MAAFDSLRDRWERMAPRERKLAAIFAGAFVLCVVVLVARGITSGLGDLEQKNSDKRDAIRLLSKFRAGQAAAKTGPAVQIPAVPVKLSRYVDEIIGQVGIDSPRYPQPKETKKNGVVEYSFKLSLPKISIVQLKDFLEKLETGSKVVVVRELHVKRNFRDQELLDVDLVIATFSKAGENKAEDKEKEKAAKDEEEDS